MTVPAAPSADTTSRKNATLILPLVVGSVATRNVPPASGGTASDAHATHRWTLYVRSPTGRDLSAIVSR
eukprot:CAMPEP_0194345180 /NCGR_PEP_ID=MMETSP0171-20130528/104705_1 /TAXON_ID=218684 /ORGANISM="Corethron pennatum, Strain L29A3" /LENGTH=68 /DNA_ID=CAMNT_0039112131 /DNA_START=66 /DNA_END=269 /DNA_ORIENTATION=-